MPVSSTSELSCDDTGTQVASISLRGGQGSWCDHLIATGPELDWLPALVNSVVRTACEDLALYYRYDDAEACSFPTIIEPPIRFEQVAAVRGTLSWHTHQRRGLDTEVHASVDADVTLEGRASAARLAPSTDADLHVYEADSNLRYVRVGTVHVGRLRFVLTLDRDARSVSDIELIEALVVERDTFTRGLSRLKTPGVQQVSQTRDAW